MNFPRFSSPRSSASTVRHSSPRPRAISNYRFSNAITPKISEKFIEASSPTNVTPRSVEEVRYFYRTQDGKDRRAFKIGPQHVREDMNPFELGKDEVSHTSVEQGLKICGWKCGLDILF